MESPHSHYELLEKALHFLIDPKTAAPDQKGHIDVDNVLLDPIRFD